MIRIRKGKKEGRVSNLRFFTASQYGIRDLRIYGSNVAGIYRNTPLDQKYTSIIFSVFLLV